MTTNSSIPNEKGYTHSAYVYCNRYQLSFIFKEPLVVFFRIPIEFTTTIATFKLKTVCRDIEWHAIIAAFKTFKVFIYIFRKYHNQ